MGRKIVNLDDQLNAVEITLGGKTWEISRVVIRLREMYGDYVQHAAQYIDQIQKAEGKDIEELGDLAEAYAQDKAVKLDAMMDKLLTKNGYEYDKEWWAENVGNYQQMEQFIVACLNKDTEETDKKKVAEEDKESSTFTG